jgi:hypothetical protein
VRARGYIRLRLAILPGEGRRGRDHSHLTGSPGIIDTLYPAGELVRPKPEIEMIARPTDITHPGTSNADLPSAETPLQRQILLWQRELMLRAAAGQRGGGAEGQSVDYPTTLPHSHENTKERKRESSRSRLKSLLGTAWLRHAIARLSQPLPHTRSGPLGNTSAH